MILVVTTYLVGRLGCSGKLLVAAAAGVAIKRQTMRCSQSHTRWIAEMNFNISATLTPRSSCAIAHPSNFALPSPSHFDHNLNGLSSTSCRKQKHMKAETKTKGYSELFLFCPCH